MEKTLIKPLRYQEMVDLLQSKFTEAATLYKTNTARKLAGHYKILYNSNWQKACFRVLGDKGLGLGGSRNYKQEKPKFSKANKVKKLKTLVVGISEEAHNVLNSLPSGVKHSQFIEELLLKYKSESDNDKI